MALQKLNELVTSHQLRALLLNMELPNSLPEDIPYPDALSVTTPASAASHDVPPAQTPFVLNRLSLIIPPPFLKPSTTKLSSRKASKRFRPGALKDFIDLPVDVVFEIASYIEPIDLLHLTRVSKEFRTLFMSRNSLSIWRRVLRQVEELPKCPQDLTEPQYASLLFEKFCMACLGTRGKIKVQLKLRLRLCTSCLKKNMVTGRVLKSRLKPPNEALSLLPSSGPTIYPRLSALDSLENTDAMLYFLPEAELVFAELSLRKSTSPAEYDGFLLEQHAQATRMMNEGLEMDFWANLLEGRKVSEGHKTALKRRKRIMTEMKALGWEKKYFPDDDDDTDTDQWDDYLNEAKELTTRGWNILRPKMLEIYERSKRNIQTRMLLDRIEVAYRNFRKRQELSKRAQLPTWRDFPTSCLDDFLDTHWSTGCTDLELDALMSELQPLLSEDFLPRAKSSLDAILRKCNSEERHTSNLLHKAKTLFTCSCDQCKIKQKVGMVFFSYLEIIDHWVGAHMDSPWVLAIFDDIKADSQAMKVAEDVILALGLPKNCARKDVAKLGKLVCRCGHPNAMTFERLVYHVYSERVWYQSILGMIHPTATHIVKELLIDTHNVKNLPMIISPHSLNDENEAQPIPHHTIPTSKEGYCRYCYQLTLRVQPRPLKAAEEAFHMKSKHGKARIDGDIAALDQLAAMYGTYGCSS
ncbi:hypothetical protein BDZ97DRAFT_1925500 [Flammula alnicola]|nr:hypothetical protein BDZ97DRAFT_1925500 [Flammula alnicola]